MVYKTALLCIVCLVAGFFFIYPYHLLFNNKSSEATEQEIKVLNDEIASNDKPALKQKDDKTDDKSANEKNDKSANEKNDKLANDKDDKPKDDATLKTPAKTDASNVNKQQKPAEKTLTDVPGTPNKIEPIKPPMVEFVTPEKTPVKVIPKKENNPASKDNPMLDVLDKLSK